MTKLKTSPKLLKYMRAYYKTKKYLAWQRAYRKKRYKTDPKYREYMLRKAKAYHARKKLKK